MPDDWVHCLFAGSIIGADYEGGHCWVNEVLDYPSRFLGEKHRLLLHDLETAKRLGTCCWWAGFVAALHIDTDNVSLKIRNHLIVVARAIKNNNYANLPKQAREVISKTRLKPNSEEDWISPFFRNAFLRIHKKVGIQILVDEETSKEALIVMEPNTLLETTWNYVNQFILKGFYVDDRPYNELPETEPRIIPHPNSVETLKTPPHVGECLDQDLLKHLFT